jgi:thiamine pyrophosphate-dependent acetolactate synthase large subunit-like protein
MARDVERFMQDARQVLDPPVKGDSDKIRAAVELMASARRPVFYTGGGVINSDLVGIALHRRVVGLVAVLRRAGVDAARELDVLRQVDDDRAGAPMARSRSSR